MKTIHKGILGILTASLLGLGGVQQAVATLVINKVWVGERTQITGRILGYDPNGALLHQTDDPDSPTVGFNKGFTALDIYEPTDTLWAATTEHQGALTYSTVDGSFVARIIGSGSSNQPQDI